MLFNFRVIGWESANRMDFVQNFVNFCQILVVKLWSHFYTICQNVPNKHSAKSGHFRWFDSGDLANISMLEKIVMICQATSTITHWLPTREVKIVSDYLKIYKEFPDNLLVRVSSPMIDGEPLKSFGYTSTVHHKEKAKGHEQP